MKYLMALGAVAVVGLTTGANAQERAAGGAMEAQVNWSALAGKIATLESMVKGLSSQLEEAKACGRAEKLYAPDGKTNCKDISKTELNTLTDVVNTTTQYNVQEQKCTSQGYVYSPKGVGADKNGCLKPVLGKPCTMNKAQACGGETNCVRAARYPFRLHGGGIYTYTQIPTKWNHGDIYVWHYDNTQNDYGGGQCLDGTIQYFTTGQ